MQTSTAHRTCWRFGLLALLLQCCVQGVLAEESAASAETVYETLVGRRFSTYIDMPDGVQLAAEVWLPRSVEALPAIVEFTRYWRWRATQPPTRALPPPLRYSLENDYAYVKVDVRGTGASTGSREAEFSLSEARDMRHVIGWVAAQPWASGRVATMGISYSGNTSEMAALYRHPALVAAVPRFTDFDWYNSIVLPGGLKNWYIATRWGDNVRRLDLNDASLFGEHSGEATADNPRVLGVQPVQSDKDGRILAAAVAEHRTNRSLAELLGTLRYRDEYPVAGSLQDEPGNAISIHRMQAAFEQSAVPMYHWGSWFDAGTAAGVLARFAAFDAPYRYVIGAWSHGAGHDANPYADVDREPVPDVAQQFRWIFDYLAPYMRDSGRARQQDQSSELLYYTVGEDKWKTTRSWPPSGQVMKRLWFGEGGSLREAVPENSGAQDRYAVDFTAGTGKQTRWSTQLGGGDVFYGDRAQADRKLLTYTSAPLAEDLEITGTPVLSLQVSSTHGDGAFIAYLEDVAPDGTVTMLTEGGLRALHRRVNEEARSYRTWAPYHSFRQVDGEPMTPGEVAEIRFGLLPVSALVRAGHSLRIALAGHDKDTFHRLPETGDPVWTVQRNSSAASWLDVPVIEKGEP